MKPRGDFDEAFRRWAGRPASMNVDPIVAALRDRRRPPFFTPRSPLLWATVTVALLVVGSSAAWWWTTKAPSLMTVPRTASRLAEPSGDSDVVVIWLDDQTPVHVFLTDSSARGDQ